MKYQGSKTKLARALAAVIAQDLAPTSRYIEPFMGAMAVTERLAPLAHRGLLLSDAHEDIALMWRAGLAGWVPPGEVTPEEYAALKHAEPSALRGFVGTTCSFAGKWFGGYARGRDGRNYAGDGQRSFLRRAAALRDRGAVISHSDYRDVTVLPGDVVYLDPPYAGKLQYRATGNFDSVEFWGRAAMWAEIGARVFVSEFSAPPEWVSIWTKDRHSSTALDSQGARAVDHLFMHESQVKRRGTE